MPLPGHEDPHQPAATPHPSAAESKIDAVRDRSAYLRAAAVVLLLLAALGAAARSGVPGRSTHAPTASVAVVWFLMITGSLAAIVLGVSALIQRRQQRQRGPINFRRVGPLPRWARITAWAITIGLLVIPAALGYRVLVDLPSQGKSKGAASGKHSTPVNAGHHAPKPDTVDFVVLATVLIVAALVALYISRQMRANAPARPRRKTEDQLAETVRAGSAALSRVEDPRQAIISCYSAMERSLAFAGLPRGAAQTPSEFLIAASSAGLVNTDAATDLTRLFEEARFSSHPMDESHRLLATDALRRLQGELATQP